MPPSGNSLALLRRLTALLEEARGEGAVAAVLECPELLAIDVDLQNDAVCASDGLPLVSHT